MASNLVQRLAVAVVAIPVVLAIVWAGGFPLVLLLAVAAVLGLRELYDFADRQQIHPLKRTGYVSAALLPLIAYVAIGVLPEIVPDPLTLLAIWLLAVMVIGLASRTAGDRPLAAVAITVFGVLYAAGLPAFIIGIRHGGRGSFDWAGAWLVFVPMGIVWIGDTVAMFGGRWLKGPKLAPTVSPGKTWSGTVAGFLSALASAWVLNALILSRFGIVLSWWRVLVFGALINIAGQVGDLTESLFKREVGVKDSSALIPGHGGVLDRLDALYFAVPVAAALYRWFGVT
jgi:phosphatidate cytidylyltransferase